VECIKVGAAAGCSSRGGLAMMAGPPFSFLEAGTHERAYPILRR
jgi:hypothetical protein